MSADLTLFHVVNGLAGHYPTLDGAMVACATYAPVLYALILLCCWIAWRQRWQRAATLAGVSALVALGIGQLVGMLFPRPRPYLAMAAHVLVTHAPDTSFPSDHAILVGAVTVGLWGLSRRLDVCLVVGGMLVLVSRVFIGVHYPSDVLGGAILGGLVANAVRWTSRGVAAHTIDRIFELLHRRRLAASPSNARQMSP